MLKYFKLHCRLFQLGIQEWHRIKEQVLFVDDDTSLLDAMSRALRREPYENHTVGSAEEALGFLKRS